MARFLIATFVVLQCVCVSDAGLVVSVPTNGLRYTIGVDTSGSPSTLLAEKSGMPLVNGSLDTDTGQVNYSTNLHNGYATVHSVSITQQVVVVPAVPAVPPVCDLNGCTPGMPEIPAEYDSESKEFLISVAVNSFPVSLASTSDNIVPSSITPTTAEVSGPNSVNFPSTLSGVWFILGPTEVKSGLLELVPNSSFALSDQLALERTPALGPVTSWSQALTGGMFIDTESGISVDGVNFDITAIASVSAVPEPCAFYAMGLVGLVLAAGRWGRSVCQNWFA